MLNVLACKMSNTVAGQQVQREIVAKLLRAGDSPRDIARKLEISYRTVLRVKSKIQSGESLSTKPKPGRPRTSSCENNKERALELIKADPSVNIGTISDEFLNLSANYERHCFH